VATNHRRHPDSLACWSRRLLIAGVLAFLCCLLGCSQGASGLKWSLVLQGSPLGIAVNVEPIPAYTTQTPSGWSSTQPALTTGTTLPAAVLTIDPASRPATNP
jgi:hypothetical protein